jgi:hypothetical protein
MNNESEAHNIQIALRGILKSGGTYSYIISRSFYEDKGKRIFYKN